MPNDKEKNRFSARAVRYAKVGGQVGAATVKIATQTWFGQNKDHDRDAAALTAALGRLKGPIMKVAQLIATIPNALPPEYATQLMSLQANAPPMGWAFVKRRMRAELGTNWQDKFKSFDKHPSAAASLGQVHKAIAHDGGELACKLQYPEMASAVEADLRQLDLIFSIYKRMDPTIDTAEIREEIGDRLREELDYKQEAQHATLYQKMLHDDPLIRVPNIRTDLSTHRLLALEWLSGHPILNYQTATLEERNRLATAMFHAWWHPFAHYGVIHGDPHLGNYTVWQEDGVASGINLLDYGCIRKFPPKFVEGVIDLYHGLRLNDEDRIVSAYKNWGFHNLDKELIDILNMWARFIYGPLLDDRERSLADGIKPAEYGRKQAFAVRNALKQKGPLTIPREFVFMDRAAIGLGSVFLHLRASLNFYQLFNHEIENFDLKTFERRQKNMLA